jgi:hypothetical protein
MRKIITVTTACLILAVGVGAWVVSSATQARVAIPAGPSLDPSQMMTIDRNLPTSNFVDYTFVFE